MENGDMLTLGEFLRRYEEMHEIYKAELIEGIVHLPSPVRIDTHAEHDGIIHGWLLVYASEQGLKFYPNATLLLDSENSCQPDSILCSKPEKSGHVWLNKKGYLCGSPELVVEIAGSTASIDHVSEYVVWRTQDREIDWFVLDDEGTYVKQTPARHGKLHSRTFKGLALDVEAALKLDGAKVLSALKR